MTEIILPLEARRKWMAQQMAEEQKLDLAAGDRASAENIAALGTDMAKKKWGMEKEFIISQLVGIAMQRKQGEIAASKWLLKKNEPAK